MQRYVATSVVSLPVGARVELSEAQAHRRRGFVKALGDGVFEATGPIQLKVGEEFGYADEMPKSMASVMQAASDGDDAGDDKAPSKPKHAAHAKVKK